LPWAPAFEAAIYFHTRALLRLLEDNDRIPLFYAEKQQKRLFRPVAGGMRPCKRLIQLGSDANSATAPNSGNLAAHQGN
jgi:hypothetical protein